MLKRMFHFLGSIYFAITLIALAASTVVMGTVLESQTSSHLFAVQWIYGHPLFLLLLCLFFINILFSALRRWPFKKRHLPFLMTHLGLLMIISGTILKNWWGLQGNLSVWEGSGNQEVILPHTYALLIEPKEVKHSSIDKHLIPLTSFQHSTYYAFHLPELKCKVISYTPHVQEQLESWIKESKVYLMGLPLLDVCSWDPGHSLPKGVFSRIMTATPDLWNLFAIHTPHVQEAIEESYLHQLMLQISDKNASHFLEIPLKEALQAPFSFANGHLSVSLNLSYSSLEGYHSPALFFTWQPQNHPKGYKEQFSIALQGQDALYVKGDLSNVHEPSFMIDLIRPHPVICFVEDEQREVQLFAFDCYGRVHAENLSSSHLQTLVAYEQGFKGYAMQAFIPFPTFPSGRKHKELAEAFSLETQLKEAMTHAPPLSPPLRLFQKACFQAKVDFINTFVQFLVAWNHEQSLLFRSNHSLSPSLEQALKALDWQEVPEVEQQASRWVNQLFDQLEFSMQQGEDLLTVLTHHQWPFLDDLQKALKTSNQSTSLVNLLAQQVSSIISYLPPLMPPLTLTLQEQAKLLSAYFRIYGIDYRSLCPFRGQEKEEFDLLETYWKAHALSEREIKQGFSLEAPLTTRILPINPPKKVEDQRPGIVLEVQQGQKKQVLALAYDASGMGLKWPILGGDYLIRFQPNLQKLPYRIRLRQARQISYPQSQQTYSYECDLLISEKEKDAIAQTLSMNRVYETWDGYRFYLAGIGSSMDQGIKYIQLVINYDPSKYVLTYPGAFLVFLGTCLLFWLHPSRKI